MSRNVKLNKSPAGKRITLNDLKEQSYTLNMQMLLAIQCHDEESQKKIKERKEKLQVQIDQLCLGGKLTT